ncbi:winged helix DNA-binding protein [Sphingomonas crocodyli]|uniref:Uncharacterized protein n=1 Tax=Sphingomonas crocodyli TaxID=1979270 RepID=A0A437LYL3_9SPHN|nr:winged helix DNA-binding protein [Sphingomonas crocodyli]RVT90455.1 hypothetical protein EOD43_19575 [Sphingomonas crocodyli]
MKIEQNSVGDIGVTQASDPLHAFARLLNADALTFIADPLGAVIISRLVTAHEAGRKIHVRELTHGARASATAMLRRLEQFENDGLICRARDPHDGRSRCVAITPKGEQAVKRAVRAIGSAAI